MQYNFDNKFRIFIKYIFLFLIGGSIYFIIETIYKGLVNHSSSHWTMFLLGGICFIFIGSINEFFSNDLSLGIQCLISATLVTVLEFVSGCVLNIWLKLDIWNYTHFDILGQICIPFSIIWFLLSGIAIFLDDYLRYWIFKEEKPNYKLF